MSEKTGISWTTHTFNGWWGCVKVSPGCKFCYAERDSNRFNDGKYWGTGPRLLFGDKHWKEPVIWNNKAKKEGKYHRVFTASMGDVFEDHPDLVEPRFRLFELIDQTPYLQWQVLTKRPENIDPILSKHGWTETPPNMWLGTSAENQFYFNQRWPVLEWAGRKYHTKNLFISAEPLLGGIDMSNDLKEHEVDDVWIRGIDWVIVGGESGDNARPMHPVWAKDIINQCMSEEVPVFFKQWGEWIPCKQRDFPHSRHFMFIGNAHIGDQWMARVGRTVAGSKIDGVIYQQFPEDS